MPDFRSTLLDKLSAIRSAGLYRQLRRVDSPQSREILVAGRACLNFSSNDYLGLANEPALREAAMGALRTFGAGAGASRLICGSLWPHAELEQSVAEFKAVEAALCFSTGYAAALGVLPAVLEKSDVVVLDKRVHASVVDAARLAGAQLRIYAHNDLDDLEDILKWVDRRANGGPAKTRPQVLIVTESVFSMDGDFGKLQALSALKHRYGAWLMVDEAHATGLYGAHRRGLAEQLDVAGQIEIQMGTLSKALGTSGGYICGSRPLIDLLINRARSFIYSTAPSPAVVAAANAAVRWVQSDAGAERCRVLWERVNQLREGIRRSSFSTNTRLHPTEIGAIIPVLIGDEGEAMRIASVLLEQGIFVPAIRYPSVARKSARLRVTVSAAHTSGDIARLIAALQGCQIPPHAAETAAAPNHAGESSSVLESSA